jgi:hypothetical protein
MPEIVEPNRIRAAADAAHAAIERLTAEIEVAKTRADKRRLRSKRYLMQQVERFMRSREGYQ